MARILFVATYYPPEIGAAQTQNKETAVRLARLGHEVTVLTTLPNYPTGVVPPEYRNGAKRREVIDGVTVARVWSYVSPNKGFFKRILAQLSFGCLAGITGAKLVGQPDIIIVVSPPLFTAIAGRVLAWRKRCPYIFNVHDLWPESAVQMGMLHNRLFIWLSERLEWSTYRRARAVWTVTEGIRKTLIRRGVPAQKVFMLPIGVDTTQFAPMPREEARAALGWDNRFTVMYAGTIGLAHGLGTVLSAAERLRDHSDIHFVLVGDGAAKAELMADAERRGLHNVTFLPAQPHQRMPLVTAGADSCVVSLRQLPLFQGALPSKMFEIMACARPVLLAVDGEARQLAEQEAGAALYVEPENADALAQAVLRLKANPQLGEELGRRGRDYVVTHMDRDRIVAALETHLLEGAGDLPRGSLEIPLAESSATPYVKTPIS
jgi:glycosyltransferase involved in cell wall biosynthesis